jgi:hypothetical protein
MSADSACPPQQRPGVRLLDQSSASFAILAHKDSPLSVRKIFVFVAGSGIAFAGINAW